MQECVVFVRGSSSDGLNVAVVCRYKSYSTIKLAKDNREY